jgi:hypothetical protein
MAKRPGMQRSFYEVLTDAIADFAEHGYDSEERLAYWTREIEAAALRGMVSQQELRDQLNAHLRGIYERILREEAKRSVSKVTGVARFGPEMLAPKMKAELDRRRMASANLIRLNREAAIQKTLQRFQGWASSVPAGGTRDADRKKTKDGIRKSLSSLPFQERRVLIDQGHKFTASLQDIVAKEKGAIAAVWESNWRQAGYDFRPDHKALDGKVFGIRGNWAAELGLMKAGPDGWSDDVEQPSVAPMCRCRFKYLFTLSRLPKDMLTRKGADKLAEIGKG